MHEYKPEIAEQLPAMFNEGETVEEVCVILGIDQTTFDSWKAQYPEFNHAAQMGEIHSERFYDGLLNQLTLTGKFNHKNLTENELIELMQKRFSESYGLIIAS